MPKVMFKRGNTQEVKAMPVDDGNIIYNTDTGESYIDVGIKRVQVGNKPITKVSELENDSKYVNETQLATKVDKVEGKSLSTNDFTTEEKNKLASLNNYDDTQIKQDLLKKADKTYVDNENQKQDTLLSQLSIKETATGNPIQVNDSIEYEPLDYKLDGYTKQETTTGKNLFNENNLIELLVNIQGDKRKGNKFIGAGTYTISQNGALEGTLYAKVIDINGNYSNTLYVRPKITQVLKENETLIVYMEDISVGEKGNIQVELGTQATPYEPYTGGQPSPSPDYPQEIDTIKGVVEAKATGKNLFDKSIMENGAFDGYGNNSSGVPLQRIRTKKPIKLVKGIYTISFNGLNNIVLYRFNLDNVLYPEDRLQGWGNTQNKTFEMKTDGYIKMAFRKSDNSNITPDNLIDGMLELSPKKTSYEPYKESKVQIDLKSNELCKIGETQDQLLLNDKLINKKFGKYVFTGNENFNAFIDTQESLFRINLGITNIKPSIKVKTIISNYYRATIEGARFNYSININNIKLIDIVDNRFKIESEFRQWLKDKYNSGNPVVIYYELATPETKPITPTGNLTMFNLNTIITTEKGNQEVKYIADTKAYVDKKLKEISKAVVMTGGDVNV